MKLPWGYGLARFIVWRIHMKKGSESIRTRPFHIAENRLLFHNQFFCLHTLLALDRNAVDTSRKVEVQLAGFTCSHIA